jgi:dienelactone hydrolase
MYPLLRLSVFLAPLLAACLLPCLAIGNELESTPSSLVWKTPPVKKNQPAVLVLGGFERSSRSLELIPDGLPIHFVSLAYPLQVPRKLSLGEGLHLLPKAKASAHKMIELIQSALSELLAHPAVDRNRVFLLGASFGAPFALIAAAQVPQVRGLILIHGFANVPATAGHRISQLWRERLPAFLSPLAEPASWMIANGAWWYSGLPDPRVKASKLSRSQKVLMFRAESDSFIPNELSVQIEQDLNKGGAKVEVVPTRGGHLHLELKQLMPQLLVESQKWISQDSP